MMRSSRNQLEPRRGGGIAEGAGSTQVTFDVLFGNLVWFLVPGVGIWVTTQGPSWR
jgi:hypothetical protein